MPTLAERFGNQVKKLRRKQGISQLVLSQKSNLDLTTINEIENGNREPILKTIWRISKALGVSMSKMFDF